MRRFSRLICLADIEFGIGLITAAVESRRLFITDSSVGKLFCSSSRDNKFKRIIEGTKNVNSLLAAYQENKVED